MTATLTRTTFETSRLLEYFTQEELVMQIGHSRGDWPIALLKELIDNALDACEAANINPVIDVEVTADTITVRDNGPGLPFSTLERSLDYAVRVSDKAFYVSPTRGQLGNALKCIYAAPFVTSGGKIGRVDVATAERTAMITVRLDPLGQRPVIGMVEEAPHVKTGTEITMYWPGVAGFLKTLEPYDSYKDRLPVDLVRRYALFNPHVTFRYADSKLQWASEATDPAWRKWWPNDPTSPHWYTATRLRALLRAYVASDRDAGRSRTVREVIVEFAGLSGTAKQKAVAEEADMTGLRLEELVGADGDIAVERIAPLLKAMQEQSRPVKAAALGVLGEPHLRRQLEEVWGITAKTAETRGSFKYLRKVKKAAGGVPWIVEAAFGVLKKADTGSRRILAGVNCSPLVDAETFHFVTGLLGEEQIHSRDPTVLVVHVGNPRIRYTDHGKSVLALEEEGA